MKKGVKFIYLFLVLALSLSLSLNFISAKEFITINSGVSGNLNSITFKDSNVGFIAGDGGIILSTSNRGKTWSSQESNVLGNLNSIYSGSIVWGLAVGANCQKTLFNGNVWTQTKLKLLCNNNVNGVDFIKETGIAVGDGGNIWKSTSGGGLWTPKTSGIVNNLNDVFLSSSNQIISGWAVGNREKIIFTSDGGENWFVQYDGGLAGKNLNAVAFLSDKQTGFAVGESGKVLKTTDGGTTWNVLGILTGTKIFADLTDIDFNGDYGVVVSKSGLLSTTSDGGTTWTKVEDLSGKVLNSVYVFEDGDFIVVGNSGYLVKYGTPFSNLPGDAGNNTNIGPSSNLDDENNAYSEFGMSCNKSEDCPQAYLSYCFNLKCVECYANEHCSSGFECKLNKCVKIQTNATTTTGGQTATCEEDDFGVNLFQKGTTEKGSKSHMDSCVNSGNFQSSEQTSSGESLQVREYFCNDAGEIDVAVLDCPGGFICGEGACILASGNDDGGNSLGFFCPSLEGEDKPGIAPGIRLMIAGNEMVYCDPLTLSYLTVKATDEACLMNYECVSNSCLDNKCTAVGEILKEQTTFLKQIWCAISNPLDFMSKDDLGMDETNNDYLKCLSGA